MSSHEQLILYYYAFWDPPSKAEMQCLDSELMFVCERGTQPGVVPHSAFPAEFYLFLSFISSKFSRFPAPVIRHPGWHKENGHL